MAYFETFFVELHDLALRCMDLEKSVTCCGFLLSGDREVPKCHKRADGPRGSDPLRHVLRTAGGPQAWTDRHLQAPCHHSSGACPSCTSQREPQVDPIDLSATAPLISCHSSTGSTCFTFKPFFRKASITAVCRHFESSLNWFPHTLYMKAATRSFPSSF